MVGTLKYVYNLTPNFYFQFSQQYTENYLVPLYWWDTFICTVIKRKDYTYAATSGHEEQRSIVLSF